VNVSAPMRAAKSVVVGVSIVVCMFNVKKEMML
jgi:hypothetical protein